MTTTRSQRRRQQSELKIAAISKKNPKMGFFDEGFFFPSPKELTSRSVSADHQHSTHKNESSSKKRTDDSAVHKSSVTQEDSKKVTDQISCGICLDIMVHPQTIVPCGHTYCGVCLSNIDKEHCPECRSNMTSLVPALQMQGLIDTLVSMPNMLSSGDVDHYRQRIKSEQCRGFQILTSSSDRRKKRSRSSSRHAAVAAMASTTSPFPTRGGGVMPERPSSTYPNNARRDISQNPFASVNLTRPIAGNNFALFRTQPQPAATVTSNTTTSTARTTQRARTIQQDFASLLADIEPIPWSPPTDSGVGVASATYNASQQQQPEQMQQRPPQPRQQLGRSEADAICLD